MGGAVSACGENNLAEKVLVALDPNAKLPNFLQKIKVKCLTSKKLKTDQTITSTDLNTFNLYSASVVYDWGFVVPFILAILLFLSLIGYMIMKMRGHHPSMPPADVV